MQFRIIQNQVFCIQYCHIMEDMIRGQECWFQFENRLNKIWEDNKNAFEGLEKQTRWRLTLAQNIEKLEILYFEIFSREVQFNDEFRL